MTELLLSLSHEYLLPLGCMECDTVLCLTEDDLF